MQRFLKKLSRRNEPYIFLVLLVLCVLIEVRSGQFFTPNNIVDKLSALVVPGIFAVGAFMVIVSGGMDVSFPALASLSAYATTKMLLDANYTGGIWLPILISLAIGVVLGAFNGIFVVYFGLPALIVTLGSSSVFKGFMQGTLASRQLAVIPEGMAAFGRSAIFVATNPESGLTSRMPMAFLVFVAVVAVAWFILNRTMFGRGIYAIGGNEVSAHRAGFSVRKTKFWMYVFVGMIASLAAGTLTGCMLGTLLIVIVENSMILLGIPTVWKSVFVGALIIIGTGVSALQVARANRAAARKTAKEVA